MTSREKVGDLLAYPDVIKARIGGGRMKKTRYGQDESDTHEQPINVPTR